MIRDLQDTIERAGAEMGLVITLGEPSTGPLLMPTYQPAERIPAEQAAEQRKPFG